jgi:hypothetical protein
MTMKQITLTTSTFALLIAGPAMAQENVQVLTDWSYDSLYADGWSVEDMFDTTQIIGASGEDIGDVENVIFSNDGKVWSCHVFVPRATKVWGKKANICLRSAFPRPASSRISGG